jgi:hypothetical protein
MSKVLHVTGLCTSNGNNPEVVNFSNLVKEVFPEFTRNCTRSSENCLRFFHLNTSDGNLEMYLNERPSAIIFDASCSSKRILDVCKKISERKKESFSPNLISIGEKCPECGVQKVGDMWEARSLFLKRPKKELVLA